MAAAAFVEGCSTLLTMAPRLIRRWRAPAVLASRLRWLAAVLGVAGANAALAEATTSAEAVARRVRPLMREFVGLNSYAQGHSPHRAFDPDLYRPVARLLREYHSVKRDLGTDPAEPAPLPQGKDGTDWESIYREWTARGWDIDASLQFEHIARAHWTDLGSQARHYGRTYARAFGPSGCRKLVQTVEIGNEPTAWNDADFQHMFRALAQGLREGDPQLRIATSNVTVRPSGRWDKSVELIAPYPELYDVLALHLYAEIEQDPSWQRSHPEDPRLLRYLNDIEALGRWRDRHAPDKAIWVTEFGYDSSTQAADPNGRFPHWIGVTDEQQAQWLVRSLLVFAALPVERAYIYFFNDRDQPSLHASAGITRNFQPKPSFHALAHLQQILGDFRFRRLVTDEPERLRVQEFVHEHDGRVVWAVWPPTGRGVTSRQRLTNLPGRLARVERMPLTGATAANAAGAGSEVVAGALEIDVTESPLYLEFVPTATSPLPMTAQRVNDWLRSLHPVPEPSVDRVIVGDPAADVRGIAVMWTPSWDALRRAETLGCNVVVAHEPTFFSHHDLDGFETAAGQLPPAARQAMAETRDAKRRWIEERGMVVIRCHDVLDLMPGGVADAMLAKLGFRLEDVLTTETYYRLLRVEPARRALDLAQQLANAFGALGQPGVTFYGEPDRAVHRLGLGTGYASDPWKFVELGADMALTIDDRIKTWTEGEWADDSGFPLVVIHHGTSEEWGVRYLHQRLQEQYPHLPVQLVPQGFRARWIPPEAD
jgi:putative NIF3 family GTP cyclohydrolase 1 type 2